VSSSSAYPQSLLHHGKADESSGTETVGDYYCWIEEISTGFGVGVASG
jgi:hypothetical protein